MHQFIVLVVNLLFFNSQKKYKYFSPPINSNYIHTLRVSEIEIGKIQIVLLSCWNSTNSNFSFNYFIFLSKSLLNHIVKSSLVKFGSAFLANSRCVTQRPLLRWSSWPRSTLTLGSSPHWTLLPLWTAGEVCQHLTDASLCSLKDKEMIKINI